MTQINRRAIRAAKEREAEAARRKADASVFSARARWESPDGMIARLSNWQRKRWRRAGAPRDRESIAGFLRLQRDGSERPEPDNRPPLPAAYTAREESRPESRQPRIQSGMGSVLNSVFADVLDMMNREGALTMRPTVYEGDAFDGIVIDHVPDVDQTADTDGAAGPTRVDQDDREATKR